MVECTYLCVYMLWYGIYDTKGGFLCLIDIFLGTWNEIIDSITRTAYCRCEQHSD